MNLYLFAYGTLRELAVQEYVFQRKLHGEPDFLPCFVISSKKIYENFLVLEFTDNTRDKVAGIVYTLDKQELLKADVYEGPAYKRIKATLQSGREAWVYVESIREEKSS